MRQVNYSGGMLLWTTLACVTHIESDKPLLESMLLSGLYISVKSMRMNPLRTSSVCSKRVSRLGLKSASPVFG